MDTTLAGPAPPSAQRLALFLIGVALGGFFDGIVLHQILEWHHLLSGVAGVSGNLRFQILADGLFHALMYVLLGWGLVLLMRHRSRLRMSAAATLGISLYGFATWHILDAVLSHWVLGIHRIRMDTARPLTWDVAWLCAFGIVPLLTGGWLMRRRTPFSSTLSSWSIVLLTTSAAAASIWPFMGAPPTTITVVMAPGKSFIDVNAEMTATDARILWMDANGSVFVAQPQRDYSLLRLMQSGALFVGGKGASASCGGYVIRSLPA